MIDGATIEIAIVIICYLIAEAVKLTHLDNKLIPVICGILGGGLGVLSFYIIPNFPADNVLSAIAVGIICGLSSTGANQLIKKMIEKIVGSGNDN